jgi:hypothetical protein
MILFIVSLLTVIMESGIHLEYNKGICDLLNRNCNETLTNVLVIIVIISFIHCSTICQNLRNILIILYGVSRYQIRTRKSKEDRQHNDEKKEKRAINDLQKQTVEIVPTVCYYLLVSIFQMSDLGRM